MQDIQTRFRSRSARGGTNGGPRAAGPGTDSLDLVDRSALLRRRERFHFPACDGAGDGIRLRRSRQVFESFSAIPRLSRLTKR